MKNQNNYKSFWEGLPKIDPRDYRVKIPSEQFIERLKQSSLQTQKFDILRQLLVQIYEGVTSDAFIKYHSGQLSEGEVKAYTAKNYMLNVTNIMKKLQNPETNDNQRIKYFSFIQKQSNQIIKEVILKYPQADTKGNVRRLKKIISRPDNRQNDEFDLLLNSNITKVDFNFKESRNYASQIMAALNYMMQITSQPLHQANIFQSNFDGFNMMLESIFSYAGCQEFEKEFIEQATKYFQVDQKSQKKPDLFEALFIPSDNNQPSILSKIQNQKKLTKLQTQFKINQKIPGDVRLFTSEQIKAGLFQPPDSSVLRVMTKWAEQLRDKLKKSRQLIQKRVQLFKTKNATFIQLNSDQKKYLYKAAQQQEKRIKKVFEKLQQNFLEMGSKLSVDSFDTMYSNKQMSQLGIFAAKSQLCIGKYMFTYLNQLIHSLLTVPKLASQLLLKQKPGQIESAQKIQQINLITFKIGDLMRARCKSNEKHIIDVYNFFEMVSSKFPKLLRVVRLKDRLDEKDNDILMNLFFMNRIQCQVQIMVSANVDAKKQHLNSFNHLIYQLKRAQFGLIAECTCIMVQYDPVIKSYSKKANLQPKVKNKLKDKQNLTKGFDRPNLLQDSNQVNKNKIILPFFCSICNKFDSNNNPNFYANRVNQQNKKQCTECYQKYLNQDKSQKLWFEQLLRIRFKAQNEFEAIYRNYTMVNIKKLQKLQDFQKIGKILLISKKDHHPMPQFSQIVNFDSTVYILCSQKKQKNIKSKILLTLTPEDWKSALNSVIILKIKDDSKVKISDEEQQGNLVIKLIQNDEPKVTFGPSFTARKDAIFLSNFSILKQTYKKQKQIVNVSDQQLTNQLQTINKMPTVKRLYCSNNFLSNISFLQKMPHLTYIDFNDNQITSLEYLEKCLTLKNIRFNNKIDNSTKRNKIVSLKGLSNIVGLQSIQIDKNEISAIDNIDNLRNLQVLSLNQNQIQKIKNLQGLLSLKQLYLNMNKVQYIENLENLVNLQILQLNGNQIQAIEKLQNLKQLQILKLNSNHIKKIQNIQMLTKLKTLALDSNRRIEKIQNIQTLQNLEKLSINDSSIQKIVNIQKQTNLIELKIVNSKISKIENLQNATKLRMLYLDFNNIQKIENLQKLVQLEILSLIKNKIKQIENLQTLTKLKTLILNLNPVKSLKGLINCPSINSISLVNSKIETIQPEILQNINRFKVFKIKKNLIKFTQKEKEQLIKKFQDNKIEYEL